MYKYRFTIFTPSYNRAYTLEKLYNDLKNQSFKDFEWLIVDDGSTDNTTELVNKFIDEKILNINYISKRNGGKHTAMNTGAKYANGELFFTVDSDDGLVKGAIEIANKQWDLVGNKSEVCGIVGLCIDEKGNLIGTEMPEDKKITYFTDLYFKYGVKGDKSVVISTEIMRKYPFPEREEVKFLPESIVLHEISKKYKVICINEPMIIREYLEDGLTQNILSESSLNGRALEFLYLINHSTYPINKYPYMWMKNYINLARYSLLSNSKYPREIEKLQDKAMYTMLFPLGYIKYLKQKK